MKLNIDAICHCGCVRTNNEDLVSVGGILLRDKSLSTPMEFDDGGCFYLFVADGMGGHEKGEEASLMLLEHLRDCFSMGDISADNFADDFSRSVRYVSHKLNAIAQVENQTRAMGCTLTGVVWMAGRLWLVNVGDSRTYLFHEGLVCQLTHDDEDAQGALTNAVGALCDTSVAISEITDRVGDDDILLLCSDGLSDVANEDYLEYFLTNAASPAQELKDWAEEQGSRDNISVIAARVGGGDFGFSDDYPDDDGRYDAWS